MPACVVLHTLRESKNHCVEKCFYRTIVEVLILNKEKQS